MFLWLTMFCFCVQLGDGSRTDRYTAVRVSGLDSGIVMIALGIVRFTVIALRPFVV